MCNCRSQIEEKLLERAKQNAPEGSKDVSVELKGYALILSGSITQKNCMPIAIEYSVPVKKAPGTFRTKTEKTTMIGSYCMFCGEKYERDQEQAHAAAGVTP